MFAPEVNLHAKHIDKYRDERNGAAKSKRKRNASDRSRQTCERESPNSGAHFRP
jgi:hypothetical protein